MSNIDGYKKGDNIVLYLNDQTKTHAIIDDIGLFDATFKTFDPIDSINYNFRYIKAWRYNIIKIEKYYQPNKGEKL